MLRIARVTEKATGHRYEVYRVTGDHGADYPVWARNGYACRCWCKDRTYRPHKPCKHMKRLQAELDEMCRVAVICQNCRPVCQVNCHAAKRFEPLLSAT